LNCTWLFTPPQGSVGFYEFTFINFNTELNYDYVTLRNGNSGSSALVERWSGTPFVPFAAFTSGPAALLSFTTNANTNRPGWDIHYELLPPTCSALREFTGVQSDTIAVRPQQYQNNLDCLWTINPLYPTSRIVATFQSFDLEINDWLLVRDGPTQRANLTGDFIPSPISASAGNPLSIRFVTGADGTGLGFSLSFAEHFCAGTVDLAGVSGNFTDGSGASSYTNGASCSWLIAVYVADQHTVLSFDAFDLASGDYVVVFDGASESSPVLGTFTGTSLPPNVSGSNGRAMLVKLVVDASNTAGGFSASWVRASGASSGGTTGSASGSCSLANPSACRCPDGAWECDLLPDMLSSAQIIQDEHTESPGRITLSNATPNVGWGPLEIHPASPQQCWCGTIQVPCGSIQTCPDGNYPSESIVQTVYHKQGNTITSYTRPAGTMTYHPGHGHVHIDGWASFTLRTRNYSEPDATRWPIVGSGAKVSFCLINLGDCTSDLGYCQVDGRTIQRSDIPNQGFGSVTGCSRDQGIYTGYLDIYGEYLEGMEITFPTGICNGDYYIVSITDPSNYFLESNETNNWVAVPITLTQQQVCTSTTGPPTTGVIQPVGGDYCQTFSSTDTPLSIPMQQGSTSGPTLSSIQVDLDGPISSVRVPRVYGTHTYDGDFDVKLTGPTGAFSNLAPRLCAASHDFDYGFSDSAASPISQISCPPTSGSLYTPVSPLSIFTETESRGTWTLEVYDRDGADVGSLSGWSVEICIRVECTDRAGPSVPIPDLQTATSTVTVTDTAPLYGLEIVDLRGTHTYLSDLTFSFVTPYATIPLFAHLCGSNQNFFFSFADTASSTFTSSSCSQRNNGLSFRPASPFSALYGQSSQGSWSVVIADTAGGDSGRITSWSLRTCVRGAAGVVTTGPLPTTGAASTTGSVSGASTTGSVSGASTTGSVSGQTSETAATSESATSAGATSSASGCNADRIAECSSDLANCTVSATALVCGCWDTYGDCIVAAGCMNSQYYTAYQTQCRAAHCTNCDAGQAHISSASFLVFSSLLILLVSLLSL